MISPLFIIFLFPLCQPIFASFCKFNISDEYIDNEGTITLHCHLPALSRCSWSRGNNFILIDGRYQYVDIFSTIDLVDQSTDCSIAINQPNAIDKDLWTCEDTEDRTVQSIKELPTPSQCKIEYEAKATVNIPTATASLSNRSDPIKMQTTKNSPNQDTNLLHSREPAKVNSDLTTICSLAFGSGKDGQIFLVTLGITVFSVGVLIGAVVVFVTKKICFKPRYFNQSIKFENQSYIDPKSEFITGSKNENCYNKA